MRTSRVVAISVGSTLVVVALMGGAFWLGLRWSDDADTGQSSSTTASASITTSEELPAESPTDDSTRAYGEEGRLLHLAAVRTSEGDVELQDCAWDALTALGLDMYILVDEPLVADYDFDPANPSRAEVFDAVAACAGTSE